MCPSNEGCVLRRLIVEMMVGLQESYISLMVSSSTVSELVLQGNDSETVVVDMFYPPVC